MSKSNFRYWRIINIILIVMGLSLPWIEFYFDNVMFQDQYPPVGWVFFFTTWQETIRTIQISGIELYLWPILLLNLGEVLLIFYLIFNVLFVIKKGKHQKNKALSITLALIVVPFLFLVFLNSKPFPGFWLANFGILSSAVLEWQEQKCKSA